MPRGWGSSVCAVDLERLLKMWRDIHQAAGEYPGMSLSKSADSRQRVIACGYDLLFLLMLMNIFGEGSR